MKKKYVILTIVVIAIVVVASVCYLTINNKKLDNGNNEETNTNEVVSKDVYLVISINPKVMLKINDDKIIEVYQLNDDAIIFTNDDLKGLNLEKGIKKIIDIAIKKEYIQGDTEIRLSTYTYTDNESQELKEEVITHATKYFIENGVHISPVSMSREEHEEIKNILKDYQEKTEEIPSAEPDTKEDNNTNNSQTQKPSNNQNSSKPNNSTSKPSSSSSTQKPSNNTQKPSNNNNSNSQQTTPTTPQPTPPSKPTTPTKLDINNVYGQYSASAYLKINNTYEGYNSAEEYFTDMVNRCNNNTILEVYPQLNSNPAPGGYDLTSACSYVKREQPKIKHGNYYLDNVSFWIDDNEGISLYSPKHSFWCTLKQIDSAGCGGGREDPLDITITSDTSKYYIEFNGIKCSAGTDLTFTCDKPVFTDDYTGKGIYTFKKTR